LAFLTEQRRRLFNGKLSIYAKEALTAISRKFIKAIFFDGRGGPPVVEEKRTNSMLIRSKY
jgi:hypothetical protein